jgi:hypothetical protein
MYFHPSFAGTSGSIPGDEHQNDEMQLCETFSTAKTLQTYEVWIIGVDE